jgi:hypothetical protein
MFEIGQVVVWRCWFAEILAFRRGGAYAVIRLFTGQTKTVAVGSLRRRS